LETGIDRFCPPAQESSARSPHFCTSCDSRPSAPAACRYGRMGCGDDRQWRRAAFVTAWPSRRTMSSLRDDPNIGGFTTRESSAILDGRSLRGFGASAFQDVPDASAYSSNWIRPQLRRAWRPITPMAAASIHSLGRGPAPADGSVQAHSPLSVSRTQR
jgi:hypothetical protein